MGVFKITMAVDDVDVAVEGINGLTSRIVSGADFKRGKDDVRINGVGKKRAKTQTLSADNNNGSAKWRNGQEKRVQEEINV